MSLGDYEKALTILDNVRKIDENFAPVHNHLGVLFEKLNQDDNAKNEYKLAIKLNPEYVEAYYNLASLCERLGFLQEAKKERGKVVELLRKKILNR